MSPDIQATLTMLVIYLLPALIAYGRGHNSAHAIAALNVLIGWTVLGWLWAAIWSLTGNTARRVHGRV